MAGHRWRGCLACVLTLALLRPAVSAETAPASEPSAPAMLGAAMPGLEAFVDDMVSNYLRDNHVGGAQVAIVKDGQVALLKGYGIDAIAPQRQVDPERSLFRIGSISKTFTWIALLQLQERGKLRLTDPINEHLPEALKIPDEGYSQPIRILDLMNHTAGFEAVLQKIFIADETQLLPLAEHLQKYRPHRVREPGKFVAYSNYGAALAGALVAHVSGTEYERYVEQNILMPLDLNHTTFREQLSAGAPQGLPAPMPPQLVADKAMGLEWHEGAWHAFPQEHILHSAPAGSAVSTAADMARYMIALLDPQRLEQAGVLQQDSVAEMRQPSFQGAPGMVGVHHGFFNMPLGIWSVLGIDNLSHNGGTLHFYSTLIAIPDLSPAATYREPGDSTASSDATNSAADAVHGSAGSLGIYIATNSKAGQGLLRQFPQQLLTKYFPPAASPPLTPPQDFAARARDYAGWYRNMGRSYTKLEKIYSLGEAFKIEAAGDILLMQVGQQPSPFVEIAPDLFKVRNADTTMAFVRDADGKITNLVMPGGSYERVNAFRAPQWLPAIAVSALLTAISVLIAALIRRRKSVTQSAWEKRSAQWLTALASAWAIATALLAVLLSKFRPPGTDDQFLFSFPQPLLKAILAVTTLAAIMSVLSIFTLWPVWRDANWSRARRVTHSLAVAIFIAFVATLADWNLLGFKYF